MLESLCLSHTEALLNGELPSPEQDQALFSALESIPACDPVDGHLVRITWLIPLLQTIIGRKAGQRLIPILDRLHGKSEEVYSDAHELRKQTCQEYAVYARAWDPQTPGFLWTMRCFEPCSHQLTQTFADDLDSLSGPRPKWQWRSCWPLVKIPRLMWWNGPPDARKRTEH